MIIDSVRVQNFRCVQDETLYCDDLTVLVGPNGSGKSTFLRALEMFFEPAAKYEAEDFYAGDTSQAIAVTVVYRELTDSEKVSFRKYIERDQLVVQKDMAWPPGSKSQKYYGMSLQNLAFAALRQAGSAQEKRELYTELKESGDYPSLPAWTSQAAAAQALADWEEANPDECRRGRDEGQFFGFKEVGEARLEQNTRFLFVPAVLEVADEAAERKGAAFSELVDLVVRRVLAQRDDVKQFQSETQKRYAEIMALDNLPELQVLQTALNSTLLAYAPDAAVELGWLTEATVDIPLPKADPKLVEDRYATAVHRAGHGLQRAFLLTLLQHLAVAEPAILDNGAAEGEGGSPMADGLQQRAEGQPDLTQPDLILGIEEPELYQHPSRQRHLSTILLQLAAGSISGVARRTQVIYATHSPLFVDIKRTDQVRVFRKVPATNGGPKRTQISSTTLEDVARELERADTKPEGTYSAVGLAPRLVTLMTPWVNEGFFAHVVVLVEGEQDRAAMLGVAGQSGCDFESAGIAVIPCNGKTNLDRPTAIFKGLDIPTYVVWDSDYENADPKPEVNRRLLRLFGENPEDWPDRVCSTYACFKRELEATLRSEIGSELFEELLEETKEHYEFEKHDQALKSPLAVQRIMEGAYARGRPSPTLNQIVSSIVALL